MMTKEKGKTGGIFKTHPPTGDRLAKVKGEAKGGAPSPAEAKRTKRFEKIVTI
jgi:predicted Zn-dependent protease